MLGSLAAAISEASASPIVIISTFDADDEGWTANPGEGSLAFVGAGGNPGGHIRITDIGVGGIPFGSGAFASAAFLGDLSGFIGGTLSLDLATFAGGGGTFASFGEIQLSGGGDTAFFDIAGAAPPLNTWQSFSAPLVAAAWGKTDLEFQNILSNVTSIGIPTDAFDGADTIGVDNFAIASQAVPEPSTAFLIAVGLLSLGTIRRRRKRP
jgi:hypothetical protein